MLVGEGWDCVQFVRINQLVDMHIAPTAGRGERLMKRQSGMELSLQEQIELYRFLSHQYVGHEDYPAVHQIIKKLRLADARGEYDQKDSGAGSKENKTT